MKPMKTVPKPTEAAEKAASSKESGTSNTPGLGLTERRQLVRPLPKPEVLERNLDSDWAEFHALSSNPSDS